MLRTIKPSIIEMLEMIDEIADKTASIEEKRWADLGV